MRSMLNIYQLIRSVRGPGGELPSAWKMDCSKRSSGIIGTLTDCDKRRLWQTLGPRISSKCRLVRLIRREMNRSTVVLAFLLFAGSTIVAQTGKGVDTQTRKIKDDASQTSTHPRNETDARKSYDWGRDKTKVRDPLPNPYPVTARRDAIVDVISQALQEKHLLIDEAASRVKDGFIITQPFVFAKGPVT